MFIKQTYYILCNIYPCYNGNFVIRYTKIFSPWVKHVFIAALVFHTRTQTRFCLPEFRFIRDCPEA